MTGTPEEGKRSRTSDAPPQPAFATYLEAPGFIVEEILRNGRPEFCVYNIATDKVGYSDEWKVGTTTYRPLPIPIDLRDTLTLADGIEEYESTKKLIQGMETHARQVFDPSNEDLIFRMQIQGALSSWILGPMFEKHSEKYASIFQAVGLPESGKGRFLTVCRRLFYRPMAFLMTTKVPSLFRAVAPWNGTLILDEADLRRSSEAAEVIEFFNARAVGTTIPRYATDRGEVQYFKGFGNTILAVRTKYDDPGFTSRAISIHTDTTIREDIPLIPSDGWEADSRRIQRQLLLWRFRQLARIRAGVLKLPTDLKIKSVRSHRVKEALLILSALGQHEPDLLDDLERTAIELDRRAVADKASSVEGMILNEVYGLLQDGWEIVREGTGYRLEGVEIENRDGIETQIRQPLTATYVGNALNRAVSAKEVLKRWRQTFSQASKEQDKVAGKKYRSILMISDAKRLDQLFRRYVVDATTQLQRFPVAPLDGFGPAPDGGRGGTSGTGGTSIPPLKVPVEPVVPGHSVRVSPTDAPGDAEPRRPAPSSVGKPVHADRVLAAVRRAAVRDETDRQVAQYADVADLLALEGTLQVDSEEAINRLLEDGRLEEPSLGRLVIREGGP